MTVNRNTKMKNRLTAKLPAVVPAVVLLAAVFGHWPYGFYTLMRLIVCGCAIYLAVEAKRMGSAAWPWVLGGVAVLFNPIVPMRMHRSDWQIVDSFAAITLIVFATLYEPHGYSKPYPCRCGRRRLAS